MTSIADHSTKVPADRPAAAADDGMEAMTTRRWVLLIATWLVLACLVAVIGLARRTPTNYVDELIFGRLAQNVAAGEGRTFQGLPLSLPALYSLYVAPAWALLDGQSAYRLALTLNAVAMTAVVLPTFALARQVAEFRWALAAGACAALVPGMVWAGMIMTEPLAYPIAALALLTMVRALRRPTLLATAAVAVTVGVACLVRTQLVVLAAVFAAAVALDVVCGGRRAMGGRLRRHRVVLIAGTLAAAVATAVLLLRPGSSLGTYECVVADAPAPGELVAPLVDYLGTLYVATLGVPLVALVALVATRSAWRDEWLAPLLCVAVAATLLFLGQAAWTTVTTSPELQERYVLYVAPPLLACLVALPGRARPRTVGLVAVAATVYAIAVFPGFADVTGDVVAERLGLPGVAADLVGERAVLWGALFGVLGAAGFLAARIGRPRGLVLALGATALFGAATLGVRQLDVSRQSTELAERMPQPLSLLDDLTGGEPAGIVMGAGSDPQPLYHLQFWNRAADRAYRLGIPAPTGFGQQCPIAVDADGELRAEGSCGGRDELPRWLVFVDSQPRPAFANGTERYRGGGIRVLEFAPGTAPRLRGDGADFALPREPVRAPSAPSERCNVQ